MNFVRAYNIFTCKVFLAITHAALSSQINQYKTGVPGVFCLLRVMDGWMDERAPKAYHTYYIFVNYSHYIRLQIYHYSCLLIYYIRRRHF